MSKDLRNLVLIARNIPPRALSSRKEVGIMRRLIALILALLMVAGGAQAAFSPVLAGLNEEMELRASLKLDTLSPLGESSIGVMNAWLSGAEIVVNQRQSSDTARARTSAES